MNMLCDLEEKWIVRDVIKDKSHYTKSIRTWRELLISVIIFPAKSLANQINFVAKSPKQRFPKIIDLLVPSNLPTWLLLAFSLKNGICPWPKPPLYNSISSGLPFFFVDAVAGTWLFYRSIPAMQKAAVSSASSSVLLPRDKDRHLYHGFIRAQVSIYVSMCEPLYPLLFFVLLSACLMFFLFLLFIYFILFFSFFLSWFFFPSRIVSLNYKSTSQVMFPVERRGSPVIRSYTPF